MKTHVICIYLNVIFIAIVFIMLLIVRSVVPKPINDQSRNAIKQNIEKADCESLKTEYINLDNMLHEIIKDFRSGYDYAILMIIGVCILLSILNYKLLKSR
jgi:hypothetical protein